MTETECGQLGGEIVEPAGGPAPASSGDVHDLQPEEWRREDSQLSSLEGTTQGDGLFPMSLPSVRNHLRTTEASRTASVNGRRVRCGSRPWSPRQGSSGRGGRVAAGQHGPRPSSPVPPRAPPRSRQIGEIGTSGFAVGFCRAVDPAQELVIEGDQNLCHDPRPSEISRRSKSPSHTSVLFTTTEVRGVIRGVKRCRTLPNGTERRES
jgi:hypothetical protein